MVAWPSCLPALPTEFLACRTLADHFSPRFDYKIRLVLRMKSAPTAPINAPATVQFHKPNLRHKLIFSICTILFALVALAAVDPATGPMYLGHASSEADRWQRIDFRSERLRSRAHTAGAALRPVGSARPVSSSIWPPRQVVDAPPGSCLFGATGGTERANLAAHRCSNLL
jgi:hypothetical protein